ncbi:MAG: amidase family protein [Oscillospiraceae bacterium]|nr:amidase family protein [Oscillospiraceae bacterium]
MDLKADDNAIVLENSIMQKGIAASAGSAILENFIAPFDATVVTRLKGGISGRVEMAEFGIGSVSDDTPGGLSEAVEAVAGGGARFALCNDVFGTYRRQAAENGLCYIHPTYGTVSRYGLIPLASSMDQIGMVCEDLSEGFKLLSVIAGNDPNDGAMLAEKSYAYERAAGEITVGVPGGAAGGGSVCDFARGFNSVGVTLKYFDICKQVMYILCCAELSGNISRYDGVKFGRRAAAYSGVNDLYLKTRTEGFGLETKLAVIMGSMALSQEYYFSYYEKAMKIRRLIKESLSFDQYDVVALPTEIEGGRYENLSLYSLACLAGLPSVSFSYNGQGVQLIANAGNEGALLAAWEMCKL